MSDLVSRKALEKAIRDYADDIGCKRGEKELANGVLMSLSKVRNAPIAYDVDKVVERLEKWKRQSGDGLIAVGVAIEIVKGVAKDEAMSQNGL